MRGASTPTLACLAAGSRPMSPSPVESNPAEQLPAIPGPAAPGPVQWGPVPLNLVIPTLAGPNRG